MQMAFVSIYRAVLLSSPFVHTHSTTIIVYRWWEKRRKYPFFFGLLFEFSPPQQYKQSCVMHSVPVAISISYKKRRSRRGIGGVERRRLVVEENFVLSLVGLLKLLDRSVPLPFTLCVPHQRGSLPHSASDICAKQTPKCSRPALFGCQSDRCKTRPPSELISALDLLTHESSAP